MPYTSSGKFPIERASKLGHLKIIEEPRVQQLLEAFERTEPTDAQLFGELSGHVDLSDPKELENIVAIDGSHTCIPNLVMSHKRIAFITAAAVHVSRTEVLRMKADPVIDPRTLASAMERNARSLAAVLPLGGVAIPGESVFETMRWTIDGVLRYTDLYRTLRFLVSREWLPAYSMEEHMACVKCGTDIELPRSALKFACPTCGEPHTLADYLYLVQAPPEDWAKEEAAIGLRNVLETLLLFSFIVLYRDRPTVLKRTLFVKDGPLLLRAQLSRLVDPVREFLEYLTDKGRELHVVGIEKTGELVDHVPLIKDVLKEPGDYFLPSVKYLHERIQGIPFVDAGYRNRVQYGAKVVIRLGRDHVIAANLPTGQFKTEPVASDLYGFRESMSLLSELLSYSFENALIPIVLANKFASISLSPSGDILETFAKRILGE